MTAQGRRLFPQFAFTFHIFSESLPLRGSLYTVGLHTLVIDKLKGVAVVEIVVTVIDYFTVNLSAAEYEVIEYLVTDETDVGSSARKEVFAT
jgi:hypothetical protein